MSGNQENFLEKQKEIVNKVKWLLTPIGIILGIYISLYIFTFPNIEMADANSLFFIGIILGVMIIGICSVIFLIVSSRKMISNILLQKWLIYSYWSLTIITMLFIINLPIGLVNIYTETQNIASYWFFDQLLQFLIIYIIIMLASGFIYEIKRKIKQRWAKIVFYPSSFSWFLSMMMILYSIYIMFVQETLPNNIYESELILFVIVFIISLILMTLELIIDIVKKKFVN